MYIKTSLANAHQPFKSSEKYFTSYYCVWWGTVQLWKYELYFQARGLSPVVRKMIEAKLCSLKKHSTFQTKKGK